MAPIKKHDFGTTWNLEPSVLKELKLFSYPYPTPVKVRESIRPILQMGDLRVGASDLPKATW